jgi:hypothetical protein
MTMFQAPADNELEAMKRPYARAAGWNGGRYELWGTDVEEIDSVLGVSLVEYKKYPGLLCSSLIEWQETAFPLGDEKAIDDGVVAYSEKNRSTVISCKGRAVKMGIAPNQELAEKVIGR